MIGGTGTVTTSLTGFNSLDFGALVELVRADIGAAGQDAVDLPHTPAAPVAGEDAVAVEIGDDLLHTERAARSIPFQEEPVDQPDRIGMQRIDLQLLLGLGAALFGGDHPIADGRQRAVPEALPGVLLQGAQDMLGVLLGLILIEQRHDLPHHDVHRIVAHLLRDGDEPDAVLRKPADVELQLEVIAEETREAVNDDDVERRWFAGSRFDHLLKLRPPVIRGRGTRFHIGLDKLIAARLAIGFTLPPLVGNGHVMLGLPDGRDAQVKGGAERHGPWGCVHGDHSSDRSKQFVQNITEPGFEHIHFAVRHRHALRPVVGDRPGRQVVCWRASAPPRGRGREVVKIVGKDATPRERSGVPDR